MSATTNPELHELTLTRIIDAPPAKVWRCWTEPKLMKEWFTPRPWLTPVVETDVRPGGSSLVLMRGPNGEENPCHGVYLEVVPNKKLVFTDAFTKAWVPSGHAFMVCELTFEEVAGGKTRYTARARHWSAEDRASHEKMGFHEGWGKATDQLEALVKTL